MRRDSRKLLSGWRKLAAFVVIITGAVGMLVIVPPTSKALFCSEIANPFETSANYLVYVPENKQKAFDREIVDFLSKNGMTASSGEQSLTDSANESDYYINYTSTACDGRSFFWSSNIAHSNQFVIIIYHNRIFGDAKALKLTHDFVAAFGREYPIMPQGNFPKNAVAPHN